MWAKALTTACAVVFGAAVVTSWGCAHCKKTARAETTFETKSVKHKEAFADLPPNAKAGECYGKVFIPPKFETVSERVCVKEASERLEIEPAKYEWVEEKVLVKDATTQLTEIPAEYSWTEETVKLASERTDWVREDSGRCHSISGEPVHDVYCLETFPEETRTVRRQCLVKPASVQETVIPAQYETVRRQKLVCPATTRKITTPAEYDTVEKTVKVADARMEWQRVVCEMRTTDRTINALKDALASAGYPTGPRNGQLEPEDWVSLKSYQEHHGLGVGLLTYQTMNALGVPTE